MAVRIDPTGRVYGGQVIAQSVIAASKTVGPSRLPHSVHGYFIAAGDIRQDLLFDVENLRDGRSFSARRVNVTQAEGSILTASDISLIRYSLVFNRVIACCTRYLFRKSRKVCPVISLNLRLK